MIIEGGMEMSKKISALKVRQNLGQVMNEVALRGDEYIIERAGKPLVAIIPIEKYRAMQAEVDVFFESLSEMGAATKEENSSTVERLIDEAVITYRKAKAKAKRRC
jgi:prevent-host-death family protein